MSVLIDQAVMSRTIRLRYGRGTGTSLFADISNTSLFITARHLVEGIEPGDRIHLWLNERWQPVEVADRVLHDQSDVALIVPRANIGEGLPEEQLGGQILVGQAAAYCGFPLGLEGRGPADHGLPVPLVKSAIFSGAIGQGDDMQFLFDTVNNVGFSGGPVVVGSPRNLKIIGTVFGYRYDSESPVMRRDPNGDVVAEGQHFVRPNSGFMSAVPMSTTLRLARAHCAGRAT